MESFWKNLLQGVLLGITQGLTEFLPISSSGHLILIERLGGIKPSLFLNLTLHLGTLLAVVILMRKSLWQVIRHPFSPQSGFLFFATLPTVFIAFLFLFFGKEFLDGKYLPIGFLATSVLLFSSFLTTYKKEPKPLFLSSTKMGKSALFKALATGIMQGFATLPGLSRSGSTISIMEMMGIEKKEATTFSFLLSLPIILGGTVMELLTFQGGESFAIETLLSGFITSFIFGFLSLKFMLRLLSKGNISFALYTLSLGIISFFI